ncbi:Protein of unknown function, partial [Gryllus bimaculatus]
MRRGDPEDNYAAEATVLLMSCRSPANTVTGCRQMASLKMTQCLPLVMLTALALHGFAQDTPQAMRAYEIFRELVMRFVDSRPSVQRHIQTLRSMD